ncbi:pirin family protein [Aquihabitans sp. McL0605]|uniref:pirin family protein n=1 Tax=Aquihabitans sp. McL0605 TaxID=3415671 RepID=UPI003CF325F9
MSDRVPPADIEVTEGRAAEVGEFQVQRVLPYRARRTVGAWCFVDQMGPGPVTAEHGLDIAPHPHIGLQTVTWLLHGEVLHRDSLGSEQVIRPGQLNLMTAGAGVSHSEETRGVYDGTLHGVQLWVALPDATRFGAPAFEHHFELPRVELDNGAATVLVGELAGTTSPARRDTDHFGADLALQVGTSTVPLAPTHEHAVAVLDGAVAVDGTLLEPGRLGYLGVGRRELALTADAPARVLLLGGTPFPDQLVMWWNYVARTRDEVTEAHHSWVGDDGRFGTVRSPLDRIVIGDPPWAG